MSGIFSKLFGTSEKRQIETAERQAAEERARLAAEAEARAQETARRKRQEDRLAASKWQYEDIVDEMRGETTKVARLISDNTVEMPFPYHGGSQLHLVVRKVRRLPEVILQIIPGQFAGDELGTHRMAARADAGTVMNWRLNESDQFHADLLFLAAPRDFARSFRDADTLMIEMSFFGSGLHQFNFCRRLERGVLAMKPLAVANTHQPILCSDHQASTTNTIARLSTSMYR